MEKSSSSANNALEIFKTAIADDDLVVQIDAMKNLHLLASSLEAAKTRTDLIPFILEKLEYFPDEINYYLSEQLEDFVPLVGGQDHINDILEVFSKVFAIGEPLVRDRAVISLRNICKNLDRRALEIFIVPFAEDQATKCWSNKCCACELLTICYPKISKEKQKQFQKLFITLIEDECLIVRKAAAVSLVEFITFLSIDDVKAEFIDIFRKLADNGEESLKVLSADLGIAIAKKLDGACSDRLLEIFERLSEDNFWKVKLAVALRVSDLQIVFNDDRVLKIYQKLAKDELPEVREMVANVLYNYCRSLKTVIPNFEETFESQLVPYIHFMLTDCNANVNLALSTNILTLSRVLSNKCFIKNILPLILNALSDERESMMPFKENLLKNLHLLPSGVNITQSLSSVNHVLQSLIEQSKLHWRTRRNLVFVFLHTAKYTTSEFFDANFKMFYYQLLQDPIFAVRRTSTLILPLLVKRFGMKWAQNSPISMLKVFAKDTRYLYRFIPLFGINELVFPTLDHYINVKTNRYLGDFQKLIFITLPEDRKKFLGPLLKIVKLHERLISKLDEMNYTCDNCNDSIELYGEDTLNNLRQTERCDMFKVKQTEFGGDEICYLEGLLFIINKDFLKIIISLTEDTIYNVQNKAKGTINNLKTFVQKLGTEISQFWVDEAIKELNDEEAAKIEADLEEELTKYVPSIEDDQIDFNPIESEQMNHEIGNSAALVESTILIAEDVSSIVDHGIIPVYFEKLTPAVDPPLLPNNEEKSVPVEESATVAKFTVDESSVLVKEENSVKNPEEDGTEATQV